MNLKTKPTNWRQVEDRETVGTSTKIGFSPTLLNLTKSAKKCKNGTLDNTVFKFISKELIINWLSTWNNPDSWLPWIISNEDHRQG